MVHGFICFKYNRHSIIHVCPKHVPTFIKVHNKDHTRQACAFVYKHWLSSAHLQIVVPDNLFLYTLFPWILCYVGFSRKLTYLIQWFIMNIKKYWVYWNVSVFIKPLPRYWISNQMLIVNFSERKRVITARVKVYFNPWSQLEDIWVIKSLMVTARSKRLSDWSQPHWSVIERYMSASYTNKS